jgi:hypothetical protein
MACREEDIPVDTVFSNFHPWGAYNQIVFVFGRTVRSSTNRSWSACSSFPVCRETKRRSFQFIGSVRTTIGAEHRNLVPSGEFSTRTTFNLPKLQRVLETTREKTVTLATYQDKIWALHHTLSTRLETVAKP